MAERPRGFGMTAELQRKVDSKYDPERAKKAIEWLEEIVGESSGCSVDPSTGKGIQDAFKDGVFLLRAMNLILVAVGKSEIKINTIKMTFKQMENIGNFLTACESFGVAKTDLFQTVDLYEATNIPQVVDTIHALGRKVQVFDLPFPALGPKEADKNKREFTEEQLKEGQHIIGLQMGSNKGASQSGQSFGTQRQIH